MTTRRQFVFSSLGALVLTPLADASTYGRVMKAGRPKLIKGNPNKVDFGHGLIVPMNHEAFETLWEGDDRWIAYGHGIGNSPGEAMAKAETAAVGTMKLYLLTEAFTPERLVRIDGGGWRLKSGKVQDLVRGDIDLPGRPVMPTVDNVPAGAAAGSGGDTESGGGDNSSDESAAHATTGWVVWKSDITLDDVRQKALLVPDGAP